MPKQPDTSTSQFTFFDCPTCKGFGYQVNGTKQHIECRTCHRHPSMYAVFGLEVLYWKQPLTADGMKERQYIRYGAIAVNTLCMILGVSGLIIITVLGVQSVMAGGAIIDLFTTPNQLIALFWLSLFIDMFVYFRMDRERASKKTFDYSKKALKKKNNNQFRRFARPTYEKIHKAPHRIKNDISNYFTSECMSAVEQAFHIAKKLGHHQVTPLHLFGGLITTNAMRIVLARLGVSPQLLYSKIGKAMSLEGMETGRDIDIGVEAQRALFYAYEEALQQKRPVVDSMELCKALVQADSWVQDIIEDVGIDQKTLDHVVEWIYIQRFLQHRYQEWSKKAMKKPKGIMDRAMTARPSPLLQSLSQDYTARARVGGFFPLIGRENEMEQVMRILRQPTGNILLVGPSGAGKSTILEGVAQYMAAEDVPQELEDKRFVMLDPGNLIANAKGVGVVEGRMQRVIDEIALAQNIILGIEDIHHLLNMRSTSGSEDVGSMLMNALSQGFLKVVATTTIEEYQQFMVNRSPFLRRFQIVKVEEMTRDDAILVLEARAGTIEYKNKVFFSYAALEAAVDFSIRFIQDRHLPAKALDILSEAAALTQVQKGVNSIVTKEEVAKVIAEKTNVQVTALTDDERQKLLNLEQVMHERIIGQNEAVKAVAAALRRAREGLRDVHRPIANVLFLGPTGVGKTELAKTVAEVYFGNENNMIRLDMSEYQDIASLRKLIGGKGERGMLTEAIRLKPFSIVLLDEFEKAHPDVLNIFLQIMDDGRVTDGTGQTFDMSNIMIIATSNAATLQIQNNIAAGISIEQIKTRLMEETLQQFFKPELLNRFDNIVLFKPLLFEEVVLIARNMLKNISNTLQAERGIVLDVVPQAVVELAQLGFDPLYGARPLRRLIQDTVNDALAKLLLSEQVSRRDVVLLQPGGTMEIQKASRL